ncbi:MAG: hypothetical protein ACR2QJ_06720 [Geminicoccaceae bacterium]
MTMRMHGPCRWLIFLVFCSLFALAPERVAVAQSGSSTVDLEERQQFLRDRLDLGKRPAQIWQYGWTGIMAASATVSAALAIDGEDETVNTVNAVKSLGSLAILLLDPLDARLGAQPMGDAATASAKDQVTRGQAALAANAERARTRTSWKRHLTVIAANVIGGGIIWAAEDAEDALISSLTGLAIGEVQIWTEPDRAINDLGAYDERFGTDLGWSIRPGINQVSLVYRF